MGPGQPVVDPTSTGDPDLLRMNQKYGIPNIGGASSGTVDPDLARMNAKYGAPAMSDATYASPAAEAGMMARYQQVAPDQDVVGRPLTGLSGAITSGLNKMLRTVGVQYPEAALSTASDYGQTAGDPMDFLRRAPGLLKYHLGQENTAAMQEQHFQPLASTAGTALGLAGTGAVGSAVADPMIEGALANQNVGRATKTYLSTLPGATYAGAYNAPPGHRFEGAAAAGIANLALAPATDYVASGLPGAAKAVGRATTFLGPGQDMQDAVSMFNQKYPEAGQAMYENGVYKEPNVPTQSGVADIIRNDPVLTKEYNLLRTAAGPTKDQSYPSLTDPAKIQPSSTNIVSAIDQAGVPVEAIDNLKRQVYARYLRGNDAASLGAQSSMQKILDMVDDGPFKVNGYANARNTAQQYINLRNIINPDKLEPWEIPTDAQGNLLPAMVKAATGGPLSKAAALAKIAQMAGRTANQSQQFDVLLPQLTEVHPDVLSSVRKALPQSFTNGMPGIGATAASQTMTPAIASILSALQQRSAFAAPRRPPIATPVNSP